MDRHPPEAAQESEASIGRTEVEAPGRQELEVSREEVEAGREEAAGREEVEAGREEAAGRGEVEALRARIRQLEDEAGRDHQFHEDLATLLEIGSRLTLADTPDELCRQAVELGRSRLRLGRLGIWFLDEDGLAIRGSFGTDEAGRTRDERDCCTVLRSDVRASLRFTPVPEITQIDGTDLTNHCNEKVGRGSLLWAPLSDGRRCIGVIFADNCLDARPYERHQPSILKRYAVMLSHLYAMKKAEAQLRASESLYKGLVGVCPDGIVVTDDDGVVRQANAQFCRLHGFDRTEEAIGSSALDLVVPEDRDTARRHRLDVAAGLTPGFHEGRLRRRDGTVFPAEVGVAKLSEGHGDSSLWICIARDITERKRIQDSLRQERNLLRTLIDSLPDHIWIKDVDSRFVVANEAVVREFGKKCMEDVIGRTDADFFPPEQAACYLAEEQEVIRTGRPIRDREVCVAGPEGSERWGLTSKIPLFDEAGVVTGLVGCVRDVTRERRLLQTLEAAEARYRMTFEAMLDPLHLVDRDLRIVLSNEALRSFVRESGSPAPETGRTLREVFPFLPEHVFDEYRVVFKTGKTLVTQERTVCGGHERFTETHKIPLFDKGEVARVVTVIHNLTTHHRIAMALSESEYRLRTIADTVPAGLCVYQDGRFRYANKMMSVLFGHTEDDLCRQLGPLDLICPEEREAVQAAIDRQLSVDSDVIRLERVCVHKTGRRFPVELTARAFLYEQAPAVLMVFVDISRRQDAERERRLLLTAVEQLNEGLAVTEPDGRVQFANPAFARMHGYEVEEVVGKDLSVFHSPEQMAAVREANRVLWETGVFDGEVWHARRDGSVFPAMMSNVLLRDSAGAGIGMIGTLRDVSRLREAEKAVEVERNLLRAVIDTVPDPLYVKDADSRFVLANQATARSCKKASPQELIGKTDFDITTADVAAFFREDEIRVMRTGRKARFMDSVPMALTADQRHYLVTKVPLRNERGEVVGIVGFNHDVTALKRAEKHLRQTSERYRQVLNAVPAIIYWADIQERKLLFVDGAVPQIAGCTADDFLRDCGCFGEIIYPTVVSGERSVSQGRLEPWEFEHRIVGGEDCPVRWVSVRIAPTADHTGQPRWIYGVITDITQRKESEAHLVRLAQAIENAGEGIGIWGSDGRLKYVNPEMTRLLGFEAAPEQLRGRSWGSLLDGTEPRWRTDLVVTLEETGKWKGNLLAKRGDGMVVPVAVTLSNLGKEAGRSEVVVNLRDRTAEEVYLAQIRKLAAGTDRLLEEERTRIARELHDELGQLVTALGLSLAWIRRATPRVRAEVRERMREAAGIGEQITAVVRDMSRSLRPLILDHQGFLAAAKSLVVDFRKATGLPCRLIADVPDVSLGVGVANAAYRILQESLTNVARHSHASQCEVVLKVAGQVLSVVVGDDGVGAGEVELTGKDSLGIVGMRERAVAIGGRLWIENVPEGGMRITAELPLERTSWSEVQR